VGVESKEDHQDSNTQNDQQIAEGSETQNNKKKKKKDGICKYTDIWRGIYLVRGENVVLLGEIVESLFHSNDLLPRYFTHSSDLIFLIDIQDLDKEDEIIKRFEYHSLETVSELQQKEIQSKAERVKKDEKILFDRLGFSKEGDEDDRY
jgi:U6 snRNA-associated Sm-like protein LSm1